MFDEINEIDDDFVGERAEVLGLAYEYFSSEEYEYGTDPLVALRRISRRRARRDSGDEG